jgi:hypothetical protein
MQTVYIGNTLVNDVMLGSQRMDDVTLSDTYLVEYLIVAGGGGGGLGGGTGGEGGGGAGGMITGSMITKVSSTNYSVTVGTGGGVSNAGNNSAFLSKTALGGGRGGSVGAENGGNGGSGGGSYITTGGTTYTPGTGLQPTEADVGYGNNGSVGALTVTKTVVVLLHAASGVKMYATGSVVATEVSIVPIFHVPVTPLSDVVGKALTKSF